MAAAPDRRLIATARAQDANFSRDRELARILEHHMKIATDVSISQRLAIGFGAVAIVFAVLLGLVLRWHADGSAAERTYSERVAPVRDRVHILERDVYRVGIALRTQLLNPSAAGSQAYRTTTQNARTALDSLDRTVTEPDARIPFAEIAAATQDYLRLADQLVAGGGTDGGLRTVDDQGLGTQREIVLGAIAGLRDLTDEREQLALAEIASIRDHTRTGLLIAGAITALLLLASAVLTARAVQRPAKMLLGIAAALRAGDWRPALLLARENGDGPTGHDEMRQLAAAFGSAAVSLEHREQRLRADADVARTVASTLDRTQLARQALHDVVAHLGAQLGVVYGTADGKLLDPIASYALGQTLAQVAVGEGVPGQAAHDRRTVLLADIPPDSGFSVRVGYDEAPPKSVAAVPLMFQNRLHGVLVVGSLREIDSTAIAFLEASATQLGIGLQNVAAHEETQRLLGEIMASNDRIRMQYEELQIQNEEIQAQNEEIQAQSEQLQAQHEEIQAQNEELLQQSEELQRNVAALAEADEHKNRFLGVLAHELRNPMTPIANSVFILKRTPPGSEGAKRAQAVIERQITHLVRLIDDLLDVTRISEGKIQLQRQRMDLVETTRACVDDFASTFEQFGIGVELDLPDEPVEVNGDQTRLAQVLGNLLSNSMKFSDNGHVKLTLRVDNASGEAVIRVTDTGIGMEASLLPHLFQPFSQGVTGLAREKGGLGLGLALVKALVTLHDGEVSAHSDGPGRGSEFTVRLPLASPSVAAARQRALREERSSAPTPRRVLIVEDNSDAASSLREALEIEGYEVAVAYTGPEGLDKAARFKPDVVLCDIGLPGLDGYEVAKKLRSDPGTRSVMLIALTGYASSADKERARLAGFDLHIAKPLRVSGFAKTIEGLARGSG
jgi:two-component system CheB/CheR fusion protein